MRLIPIILQLSRFFVAITLTLGPISPAYAGFDGAPSPSIKDNAAVPAGDAETARAAKAAGNLKIPMYFEKNHGQTDASVKFFTRASGYNLYLTGSQAVTVIPRAEADKAKGPLVVRMTLEGANARPAAQGQGILPGRTSYFFGSDSSKWQTGVEQYAGVKFGQVYPGIDMVYRFDKGNTEYDFVVAPGANPGRILMGFEGNKGIRLDPQGNLVLGIDGGALTYKAPKLYQTLGARRVPVTGRFVLASNKNVRFEVGNYNKAKVLVIDPQIAYSTYLGGSADDAINSIRVDNLGQAYVTGWSVSAMTDAGGFSAPGSAYTNPTTTTNNGGKDVFVAKFNAAGSALLWLAWLGGGGDEQANGLALETTLSGTPKVYITGQTASGGVVPFPTKGNPTVLQVCAGMTGTLAFVAELSQAANNPNLVYSTCFGGVNGTLNNSGNAIAVDSLGAAYVTGTAETSFTAIGPAPAPYNTFAGASDAFVLKIAAAGAGIAPVYAMFLGQTSGTSDSKAIAVDNLFQAWVGGATTSDTFPGGVDSVHHFASARVGATDAFVAKVKADGSGLGYATYINGNLIQYVTAIALNHGGVYPYHVFVAGDTNSPTSFPSAAYYSLPTTGPGSRPAVYQKDISSGYHPFIARLNPDQTPAAGVADTPLEMVYATHLGSPSSSEDHALALALDTRDDAYIAGWTLASDWVITTIPPDPLTDCSGTCVPINPVGGGSGSAQSNTSGAQDGFVAAIGPTGVYQPFFSYLGASAGTPLRQAASGIAMDPSYNIYVAGYTPSMNFPLTTGSLMDGSGGVKSINGNATAGMMDGFVMKIAPVVSFGGPLPNPCTITNISPNSGFTLGGGTVTITGTDLYGFTMSSVTFGGVAVSSFTMYGSSTSLTAVSPAHSSGLISFTLTNDTGTCSGSYTYIAPSASCTITGISPISGFTTGGTTVTITGTGLYGLFVPGAVTFGLGNAASYSVNTSSTVVLAVSPRKPLAGPLSAGSVLITLVTSSGTCSVNYAYIAAPAAVAACGEDYFYPSPAAGATGNFAYCMAAAGTAKIKIYNTIGDLVAKLDDSKAAGNQLSPLNTARLASGVYLYRLEKDYGGGNSTTSKVKKFVVRH